MRQVLLRIPDELHARLMRQAEVEGRSMNTLAKELLDTALPDPDNETPRERVRRIAKEMGSLREYPSSGPALSPAERAAIIEQFRGVGAFIDDFLAERR
ncbi:MAG TPA: toxin-antitoxin system HicB family antitoxin [Acidimicrobiales bacterium]